MGQADKPVNSDDGSTLRRLDLVLRARYPALSRSQIKQAIDDGRVSIVGVPAGKLKPSLKISEDQEIAFDIEVHSTPELGNFLGVEPTILFEDEHIVVLDKPPAMPMYPQKSGDARTVANFLNHRYANLPLPPGESPNPLAAGIVHRLDADTTGVTVCARTVKAMTSLKSQFRERAVTKRYWALVQGVPKQNEFQVSLAVERDPQRPVAMRATKQGGKEAHTTFRVLERFAGFTFLEATPETGRTHQIRVHLTNVGFPILGDRLYSKHPKLSREELLPEGYSIAKSDEKVLLNRQALHAFGLGFQHPVSGEKLAFEALLPEDMSNVLDDLRKFSTLSGH